MPRIWHHYPEGVKTVWPAETLPAWDSIHRADFINQFISWRKYIADIANAASTYFFNDDFDMEFVNPGDCIQEASFYNRLAFVPQGTWWSGWPTGWLYVSDETRDLFQTPGSMVEQSPEYASAPDSDLYGIKAIIEHLGRKLHTFERGDDLQNLLPTFYMNLRFALDSSKVMAGPILCKNCTIYHWNRYGTLWLTQDFEEDSGLTMKTMAWSYELRHGARKQCLTNMEINMGGVVPAGAYGALMQWTSSTESPFGYPNPLGTQMWIHEASTTTPATLFTSPMPDIGRPPFSMDEKYWAKSVEGGLVVYDELPEQYLPPE